MTEVALGILANLATHQGCAARILAQEGLVAVMLDRLLTSIHAPTLTEVPPVCSQLRLACWREPHKALTWAASGCSGSGADAHSFHRL